MLGSRPRHPRHLESTGVPRAQDPGQLGRQEPAVSTVTRQTDKRSKQPLFSEKLKKTKHKPMLGQLLMLTQVVGGGPPFLYGLRKPSKRPGTSRLHSTTERPGLVESSAGPSGKKCSQGAPSQVTARKNKAGKTSLCPKLTTE